MHRPLSVDHAVKLLHEATASSTGDAFFRALARSIAGAFDAPIALVGRLEPDGRAVRGLAFWMDGQFAPLRYDVHGTPCANVMATGETCQYTSGVAKLFPEDAMLTEAGIEAYFGVPITSVAHGGSLGLLVALHREPTEPIPELEAILGLFATRAAAEIERLEAESTLARRESLYRTIVTQCSDGVWLIDGQGSTTYVNPQMARMIGREPDEMIGHSLFDFMDDEGRRIARQNLERRQRGIAERHEFRLIHRDGTPVWTLMSTGPVSEADGGYAGALAIVSDLTERRALEARVYEAQRLESIGVLAGGIAHDFNNVLLGILGNVELALLRTNRQSPSHENLEAIQKAALRAADLTRQLLTYAGRARPNVGRLRLDELLRDTRDLLATTLPKRVTLSLDLDDGLPEVLGDRGLLIQVFMNLVTNAGDATSERGGSIRIRARHVAGSELDAERSTFRPNAPDVDKAYARIDVTDEGTGMDEVTQQRIFDPFFTTKVTGRGLGLAAVIGILRTHEGAVSLRSALGEGTTFSVLLPAADPASAISAGFEVSERAGARGPASTVRILVVDDEPTVRDVTSTILLSSGFEVDTAIDGVDALAKFDAAPDRFGAILLDLRMPQLGGLEVLLRVRALRPEIPIVVVSGYSESMDRLPLDAKTRLLAKPYAARELLAVLDALLGGRLP